MHSLLSHKGVRKTRSQFLPLFVKHAQEAIIGRRLLRVIPLFGVTSYLVRRIRLNGQQRVDGLGGRIRLCVTEVSNVLIHEYGALGHRGRILQDAEFRDVRSGKDLGETKELGYNGVTALSKTDRVVENGVLGVYVEGAISRFAAIHLLKRLDYVLLVRLS
jgi:hypothetical protein